MVPPRSNSIETTGLIDRALAIIDEETKTWRLGRGQRDVGPCRDKRVASEGEPEEPG
jgi:hypothetical protein